MKIAMRTLIWKSLMHRKLQTIVMILSIAIGAGVFFSVANIYQGVKNGTEFAKQRMGADLVVVPQAASLDPGLILFGGASANTYMPSDTINKVRNIPGVAQATPQFFTGKLTADCHDIGDSIRMLGYDPASDWVIKPWLSNFQKDHLEDNEIILGSKVQTWTEKRIEILGKWYNIVGSAKETGTTLDYSIFVNMGEARRVAAKGKFSADNGILLSTIFKEQGSPENLISAILVKVDKGADIKDISDQIFNIGPVQPIAASEVGKQIGGQITAVVGLLAGVGILIALIALFQLFSRLYALVSERKAEWGLYLAIGGTRKKIVTIITGEAVSVALAGAAAGILLGGIFYQVSLKILEGNQNFPYVAPSWQFAAAVAGLLILAFSALGALAAWLPAYRGSRTDPSTIMTQGEFN